MDRIIDWFFYKLSKNKTKLHGTIIARLPPSHRPRLVKHWYKINTGQTLDLENPQLLSEKMQWLKLYDTNPLKTLISDKYRAREWVAEQIGEEYLVPLLGVWDAFEEIDFTALPDKFVLKANHGSGWNMIVRDKSTFDEEAARKRFASWMRTNFALRAYEWHYGPIPPKIVCERYLETEVADLPNYKILCFNGKVEFISVITLSEQPTSEQFDKNWNIMPYEVTFPRPTIAPERPQCLELMVALAERLSQGFPLVRVDLYEVGGKVYFGEMTFYPTKGILKFKPGEYDAIFGQKLKLPFP